MSSEPWAPLSIVYVNTSETLLYAELVSDDSLFVDATAHNMGLVSQRHDYGNIEIKIKTLERLQ